MSGQIVFRGHKVKARYDQNQIAMYQHNPYIEALPPIYNMLEVASRISRRPALNKEERRLPALHRLHSVQTIANFVEPIPHHLDLEAKFSRMIRNGYTARNPMKKEWVKQVRSGFPDIIFGEGDDQYEPIIRSSASGFAILGASGVGKTTAIESVLGLYPQVIVHTEYNGKPFDRQQLVWLKLDCPQDGSIKGLCLNFFQSVDNALGTNYYKKFSRNTVDVLLLEMGNVAFALGLGVLVIDEIQRLTEAKSGGAKQMINAFVQLINVIGVPLVTVGTFKAVKMLSSEFATARRSAGQGDTFWSNFVKDEIWDDFIESLWEYQWTKDYTPLTPALNKALYDESQGIIDIAVKLFMIAQWNIINEHEDDKEKITVHLIREVAKENFKLARPILKAMKKGLTAELEKYEDVVPSFSDLNQYLKGASEKVTLDGALKTLSNQQKAVNYRVADKEESPFMTIAQWLVDAGFPEEVAKKCSKKSLSIFASDHDLRKAMDYAYEEAKRYSQLKEEADGFSVNASETKKVHKGKNKSSTKLTVEELKELLKDKDDEGLFGL
ncbi:ATP-binding protein [Peribacillus frigoritolerans]